MILMKILFNCYVCFGKGIIGGGGVMILSFVWVIYKLFILVYVVCGILWIFFSFIL